MKHRREPRGTRKQRQRRADAIRDKGGCDEETLPTPKTIMRPAGTESKKNKQTLSLQTLPVNLLGEVMEYLRNNVCDIVRLKMVCKLLRKTMKSMKRRANNKFGEREYEDYFSLKQYYHTYRDAFATIKVPPKIGVGATQVVLRGRHPYQIGMRFCLGLIPKQGDPPQVQRGTTLLDCYFDLTPRNSNPDRLSVNLIRNEKRHTLIRGSCSTRARQTIEDYKKNHDCNDESIAEPWTIVHMVLDWENCTLNATMKTSVGKLTGSRKNKAKTVTETYSNRYPYLNSEEFQCQGIQWIGIGGDEDVYDQQWSHIAVF